jgi:hypothetical protein
LERWNQYIHKYRKTILENQAGLFVQTGQFFKKNDELKIYIDKRQICFYIDTCKNEIKNEADQTKKLK